MMKKLPLRLLDHDLSGIGSHNATTALSILESVDQSVVWANVNCGLVHPRALKVFTHSNFHSDCAYAGEGNALRRAIDVLRKTLRANRLYARSLRGVYRGGEAQAWLARDCDPKMVYALIWFGWRHRSELSVVCYFHNHPSRLLLRPAGWLLRGLRLRNVVIAAEDTGLAGLYSGILGVPVIHVVYPLPEREASLGLAPAAEAQPFRIVLMGSPRVEKGADVLLRSLIELKPELLAGQLEIGISLGERCEGAVREAWQEAQTAFGAEEIPGLKIHPPGMPEEAYIETLYSAHATVLPYRHSAYQKRNSGVVLESIAAEKPMLVTADTLLGETAKREGVALFARDGSPQELASTIRQLIAQYPGLKQEAVVKGKAWRAANRPGDICRRAFSKLGIEV